MYAIVKTGGKQYRVQEGQHLLVERLPAQDGDTVSLHPLLVVDGDNVLDGDGLDGVDVSATIVGHERGPKLRIVKFKPKRGYKRRTGHRQELTRIRVESIGTGSKKGTSTKRASSRKAVVAADAPAPVEEVAAPTTPEPETPTATATAPETPTATATAPEAPTTEPAAPEAPTTEPAAPEAPAAAPETTAAAPEPAAAAQAADAAAEAAEEPKPARAKRQPKEAEDGS